jgi:hypothetical protein
MLVVAGILIALVALLAVPADVAIRLEGIEPFEGRLGVRWLFGLVRVRFRVPRTRKPRARETPEPGARARRKARVGPGWLLAVARQPAFRHRAWRLVAGLLRAVRPRGFWLRGRLGLGDPADTGRLWAIVGPLEAVARGWAGADVRIEPEFFDAVLELRARGRVRVIPLQVLALGLRFALSPPSIRAWRTLRAGDG